MTVMVRVAPLALVLSLVAASPGAGQQSRCADCHFASPDAPHPEHVSEWDRSAHARASIGCHQCHGGNPDTFERLLAHRGILRSGDPKSPVNRASLPTTCGKCHTGQLIEFQKSRHFQLLKTGDRRGPTCSTCHDPAGSHLLSPKALEGECNSCHGPGKQAPRPERAKNARLMLEGVRDTRTLLKENVGLIARIKDPARRSELTHEADLVDVPLKEAVFAAHSFVYDGLQERLAVARNRLSTLLEHLANPAAGSRK